MKRVLSAIIIIGACITMSGAILINSIPCAIVGAALLIAQIIEDKQSVNLIEAKQVIVHREDTANDK